MTDPFVYTGLPSRIVFGAGALDHLGREIEMIGSQRALVVSTAGQRRNAENVVDRLGTRCAGMFDRAVMHVPVEIANEARETARKLGADCVVTIGGGSTTGLGKAIAMESSLPILAIPTTYSGSEVTPIFGVTEGGAKRTGRDVRVLPKTVIYDPQLTLGLPIALSVVSGMNAIAHAIEALYAQDANPIMSMVAEEGLRGMAAGLKTLVGAPRDLGARSDCLYGAWLCGTVLGSVGMALHHKLCHTLGGSFNLPHAETHTVVLPHATAFNEQATGPAMVRARRALGATGSVGAALFDLAHSLGAPTSLASLGMKEADLDLAADLATRAPYWNPRSIDRAGIRKLLDDAFRGRRPSGL